MNVWIVAEHDISFVAPITISGRFTGIVAVSIEAAKEAIKHLYFGEIIREEVRDEFQVRVMVASAPLSTVRHVVLSITEYPVQGAE